MEDLRALNFKLGDRVESRSFIKGFRGAWFRCEIKKACQKRVAVEYYDFPEDKINWMKSIYHKTPWKKGAKEELMLRPQFPPVYREGETPDVNTLSEVIVVTNGVWKVGDLADWYCDNCYWSGTIMEFKGDDKVQFKLHPKPMGEDLSYEAFCKDLRPSLEWSQESGWAVPVPKGSSSYCPCARLIQPINQGKLKSEAAQESPSELNDTQRPSSAHSHRFQFREKVPKTALASQDARPDRRKKRKVDAMESGIEKGNIKASAEAPNETVCKDHAPEDQTSKLSKNIPVNSSNCDPIQPLLAGLEELLNRVKWLRRILEPPESEKHGWKFEEYRAGSSTGRK